VSRGTSWAGSGEMQRCPEILLLRSGRSKPPRVYRGPCPPTVIPSEAGRLFPAHSLLRMRRPAQRGISLLFFTF